MKKKISKALKTQQPTNLDFYVPTVIIKGQVNLINKNKLIKKIDGVY